MPFSKEQLIQRESQIIDIKSFESLIDKNILASYSKGLRYCYFTVENSQYPCMLLYSIFKQIQPDYQGIRFSFKNYYGDDQIEGESWNYNEITVDWS